MGFAPFWNLFRSFVPSVIYMPMIILSNKCSVQAFHITLEHSTSIHFASNHRLDNKHKLDGVWGKNVCNKVRNLSLERMKHIGVSRKCGSIQFQPKLLISLVKNYQNFIVNCNRWTVQYFQQNLFSVERLTELSETPFG